MLTLAEAARRDALEVATPDKLVRWRADMKARTIAFWKSEYSKTPFADIDDLDIKAADGPLDDALVDATYHLIWEME